MSWRRRYGAELISYFRWRQVPFAQEQMHVVVPPDGRDVRHERRKDLLTRPASLAGMIHQVQKLL